MIRLENLRIELDGFTLGDLSLAVRPGELFTLLGPTGAGKTLVLEAVAGVMPVTSGRILLGGRDVTRLPPERRGVGIVYQDYALFPHLSVIKNILYGLRYHDGDGADARRRVDGLVDRLGLGPLVNRSVTHLSGGEKQRTALARALAVRPEVLLLDEPLSALDPNFREEIRDVLKELHRELEVTVVLVTHDFAEALFLGERTALIRHGRLEQVGVTREVFRKPATPFAAEFVGMKNVFRASFDGDRARVGDLELRLESPPGDGASHVAARPEDVVVQPGPPLLEAPNLFEGRLVATMDRGAYREASVRVGEVVFKGTLSPKTLLEFSGMESGEVHVHVPPPAIHAF